MMPKKKRGKTTSGYLDPIGEQRVRYRPGKRLKGAYRKAKKAGTSRGSLREFVHGSVDADRTVGDWLANKKASGQ